MAARPCDDLGLDLNLDLDVNLDVDGDVTSTPAGRYEAAGSEQPPPFGPT